MAARHSKRVRGAAYGVALLECANEIRSEREAILSLIAKFVRRRNTKMLTKARTCAMKRETKSQIETQREESRESSIERDGSTKSST